MALAVAREEGGPYLEVNQAWCEILGYSEEELLAMTPLELTHPEDQDATVHHTRRAMSGEVDSYQLEKRYIHAEGHVIWASTTASLVRDMEGHPQYFVVQMQDVTERKRIEEALQESEKRFRTFFEQSAVGISIANLDRRLLETNPAYQRITGYSAEELFGKPIAEISHPEDVPVDEMRNEEILSDERDRYRRQKQYIRKDGETIWVKPTVSVVRDYEGEPQFLVGMVEDVTERKQMEEALRESEERFKTLFEQSVDILIVHDDEGRILDCNPEACRSLGYTREELLSLNAKDIGKGFLSSKRRRGREKAGGTLWQRIVDGDSTTYGTIERGELKRKDGKIFPVEVRLGGVDYGGRRMILSSIRDITDRKEAERRLEESRQRYKSLFEHNPDAVYSFDLEGNFLSANPACEELTGYAAEELLQMSFMPLIVPEYQGKTRRHFERAADGESQNYENAITCRNGDRAELSVTKLPIIVGGEVVGVYGIAKDITERKRTEEALRQSEARFRTLFEQNTVGVRLADLDRRLISTNAAYQQITGYSEEELVGMSTLELTHPDDRADDESVVGISASDGDDSYRREKRYVRKDGEVVWAFAASTLVRDESGEPQFIMGVVEDVTERRRADEELRESEERFHGAFDNTPIGMALVDLEGRYLQVNRAMCEILGYSEEEFLVTSFQEITHPEDYEKSLAYARRMWQGEIDNYSLEKRYVHAEGHPVWVNLSVSLLRGMEGVPLYHIAQVQDITGRKRAETALRESEERYRSLVELSPEAIVVHSEGEIVYANTAAAEMLRASGPEEMTGRGALDFVHPDYRETVTSRIIGVLESGETAPLLEEKYVRLDGSVLDVEVVGAPVHYLGKPAIQVVLRDITERKKAEEALRASEERYRAVIERMADGVHIYDFQTKRVLETNTTLQDMLGYTAEELSGLRIYDFIANDREEITRNGQHIIEEKSVFLGERRYRRKDGSLVEVESSATVIPYAGKEAVCTMIRDIAGRKRTEEELRKSEARNKAILETTPDLIFIYSRDGEYLDIQANYPDKLYLPREELLGKNLGDVLPSEVAGPFLRTIGHTLDTGEVQAYEYKLEVPGGALDFESRMVASGPDEVLCAVRDITERKALEQSLEYQAFHDFLTGLPNRALFMDRIQHALARADRRGEPLAVLFLDLDNFKLINDSLGHAVGDQLIAKIAHRLESCLRPEDTVARLAGDEFIVLLEASGRWEGATRVAERIIETLQPPFVLSGHEVSTTASIGIAVSTSAHNTPDELLRNADYAMYRAKEQGKANYEVFDPSMAPHALERLKLENELKRAIEREEFVVHYQPKIELSTGEIVGVEALVRWDHPERGLILPEEFISLAEETGLIIPIGNRVLEIACRQACVWQEQCSKAASLMMCVNLSARQVQYPRLTQEVIRIIQETGVDPKNLDLEVTESVAMEDVETTSDRLLELKQLGIELAIDDFGTGYSSLSYLKRLPADVLKIDQTFIWGLGEDPSDKMLVSAIIELAHALGLETVAEGVEKAVQLEQLRKLGCDAVQGNYLVQAVAGEKVPELIEAGLPVL